MMLQLNNLVKITKKRKRVGRGGSRGGTSGKGGKGQTARSGGYVRRGFEGGQLPLYRRLPKRGFKNGEFKVTFETINLKDLELHFDADITITREAMIEKGIVKGRQG